MTRRIHVVSLLFFAALLALSFYANAEILRTVEKMRFSPLNELMLFITKDGLTVLIAAGSLFMLWKKKYAELALILLAVTLSLETGFLLKKILQVPRPYATEAFALTALKHTSGYSFPSLHAAFCLAVIPFLNKIFRSRTAVFFWSFVLLVVVASRIYLGLHYMSDLLAGGLIGYLSAVFWLRLDAKYALGRRLVQQLHEKLELRRQLAHVLTGISLLFLISIGIVTQELLAVVLVAGSATIVLSKHYRLPFIYPLLKTFERSAEMNFFPGKGAFFFVLGSLLSLLLFERNIALASIAIMTVGDAITTIVGTYFGRVKNPFNSSKHLEGTMLAIIVSTIAAFTFVGFEKALFGSVVGIIFESLTIRFVDRVIDDNLLIPLVAGVVMTAMG